MVDTKNSPVDTCNVANAVTSNATGVPGGKEFSHASFLGKFDAASVYACWVMGFLQSAGYMYLSSTYTRH